MDGGNLQGASSHKLGSVKLTVSWAPSVTSQIKSNLSNLTSPLALIPTTVSTIKPFHPRVFQDPRTSEGVIRGTFASNIPSIPCTVVATCLPVWGFVVEGLGLILQHVHLVQPHWSQVCKNMWPLAGLTTGTNTNLAPYKHAIMFYDNATLPTITNDVWVYASLIFVFMAHKQKFTKPIPTDWKQRWMRLSHIATGGCTDGFWTVGAFSKTNISPRPIQPLPGRQVMGVWDSTIGGHEIPYAPPQVFGTLAVRPLSVNVFSPFGLFPTFQNASEKKPSTVQFIGASVFSATKYVSRRLSPVEIAGIWDYPLRIISLCSKSLLQRDLLEITRLPPCKILHTWGSEILGQMNRGGT